MNLISMTNELKRKVILNLLFSKLEKNLLWTCCMLFVPTKMIFLFTIRVLTSILRIKERVMNLSSIKVVATYMFQCTFRNIYKTKNANTFETECGVTCYLIYLYRYFSFLLSFVRMLQMHKCQHANNVNKAKQTYTRKLYELQD